MFCPNCGLELDNTTAVCPACSTVLKPVQPVNSSGGQAQDNNIAQATQTTDTPAEVTSSVHTSYSQHPATQIPVVPESKQAMPTQTTPAQATPEKPIPNYLVWSILCTVFCCLPFGVVGLVYSNKVTNCLIYGKREEAMYASKNAKTWDIIATVIGIVAVIVYLVYLLLFSNLLLGQ